MVLTGGELTILDQLLLLMPLLAKELTTPGLPDISPESTNDGKLLFRPPSINVKERFCPAILGAMEALIGSAGIETGEPQEPKLLALTMLL